MAKDKEEKTDIDREQEFVPILGIRQKWVDVALKIFFGCLFYLCFLSYS